MVTKYFFLFLARIASRPGQSGRCDGYILEGKELEFYIKKIKVRIHLYIYLNHFGLNINYFTNHFKNFYFIFLLVSQVNYSTCVVCFSDENNKWDGKLSPKK